MLWSLCLVGYPMLNGKLVQAWGSQWWSWHGRNMLSVPQFGLLNSVWAAVCWYLMHTAQSYSSPVDCRPLSVRWSLRYHSMCSFWYGGAPSYVSLMTKIHCPRGHWTIACHRQWLHDFSIVLMLTLPRSMLATEPSVRCRTLGSCHCHDLRGQATGVEPVLYSIGAMG